MTGVWFHQEYLMDDGEVAQLVARIEAEGYRALPRSQAGRQCVVVADREGVRLGVVRAPWDWPLDSMIRITTPHEAAKDLIRVYVLRGDTLESLRLGGMGSYSKRYRAEIGPYGYRNDQIVVTRVGETPCHEVFSLPRLYEEIKSEATIGKQLSLFEGVPA